MPFEVPVIRVVRRFMESDYDLDDGLSDDIGFASPRWLGEQNCGIPHERLWDSKSNAPRANTHRQKASNIAKR
jgi:hypothetical protein